MRQVALMLALSLVAVGCKEKPDPDKDKKHVDFRPVGGSTTLAGKMRDRALDARMMNDMNGVKIGLDADMIPVPNSKEAWVNWLRRDFKILAPMVEKGEVIAFTQVRLGDADTVLMYETRIATDPDAIVLTADGRPQRLTKAQFDMLKKPAK